MEKAILSLGSVDLVEAKRIRSELEIRGVEIELVSHPDSCSSKQCKPTVEILVREADLPVVQAFLKQELDRGLEALDFNPALLHEVFDPEKETATCPACGQVFSTQLTECPECGLNFGGS